MFSIFFCKIYHFRSGTSKLELSISHSMVLVAFVCAFVVAFLLLTSKTAYNAVSLAYTAKLVLVKTAVPFIYSV